jgi:hypothetical protein
MVVKKLLSHDFFYFFIKIHFLDHDMFYLKNNVSNKKIIFFKTINIDTWTETRNFD